MPWSRSRYWLCHFLHNRHTRPRRKDAPRKFDTPIGAAAWARWMADFSARAAATPPWLVTQAVERCADDPAFVQALRLWLKEQQYLAQLTTPMDAGAPTTAVPHRATLATAAARLGESLRQWLGLRFELSLHLLRHLLETAYLRRLLPTLDDQAAHVVWDRAWRDRRAHVAFVGEWLTREFADFNFLRRNLRRWRLRGLFIVVLGVSLWRHGALLRHLSMSRTAFAWEAWRSFARLLEEMVPYHREALLQRLLTQREHPYDKPVHLG